MNQNKCVGEDMNDFTKWNKGFVAITINIYFSSIINIYLTCLFPMY